MGIIAQAKESVITEIYVNPLYEDLGPLPIEKSAKTAQSPEDAKERELEEEPEYFTDAELIAKTIRKGMLKRESVITFYYKDEEAYDRQDLTDWFELAQAETDNSEEGDYLRWNYQGYRATISNAYEDGTYYFKYVMEMTYYTTRAQEDELNAQIDEVLNSLGVKDPDLDDYEKVKRIYDYICENVVYDNEHSSDTSYKMQFTAYAAMMHKTAVCQGYATLMYRMMEECGIDTRVVFGTSRGVNHTWNIMNLGDVYYLADSTWDAGDSEYNYFLNGKSNFAGHTTESEFMDDYAVSDTDYQLNSHIGKEKPYAEIDFAKTESNKAYTGDTVHLSRDVVMTTNGYADYYFEYYLDEECSRITYEGDEIKEGSAPKAPGIYYVKAIARENGRYQAAQADAIHEFTIRPRKALSFTAENSSTGIKLTWEEREEAQGYVIYRKTGAGEYEVLATISGGETLAYTDKSIKQGTKYRYNIVTFAKDSEDEYVQSLKREKGTNIVRVKVTSIVNQNGSVKVKWNKVPDAVGYKVYRKASGYTSYGLLENIKNGSKTEYIDDYAKSIRNGKASYYYVVPYYEDDSDVILKSNTKTNYYVSRPSVSSLTTSGSGALKVEWKKNDKASGYQIRYSTSSTMADARTIEISSKSTLIKKISDLKKNKLYYVQVRAYKTYKDIDYYSAWSAKKSKKTS